VRAVAGNRWVEKLYTQLGDDVDSQWAVAEMERINSSLSVRLDASKAASIRANEQPKRCYVGQYPFNEGFLLDPEEAQDLIGKNPKLRDVIFPYMIGRDLEPISVGHRLAYFPSLRPSLLR
jgi:hypothetical protein